MSVQLPQNKDQGCVYGGYTSSSMTEASLQRPTHQDPLRQLNPGLTTGNSRSGPSFPTQTASSQGSVAASRRRSSRIANPRRPVVRPLPSQLGASFMSREQNPGYPAQLPVPLANMPPETSPVSLGNTSQDNTYAPEELSNVALWNNEGFLNAARINEARALRNWQRFGFSGNDASTPRSEEANETLRSREEIRNVGHPIHPTENVHAMGSGASRNDTTQTQQAQTGNLVDGSTTENPGRAIHHMWRIFEEAESNRRAMTARQRSPTPGYTNPMGSSHPNTYPQPSAAELEIQDPSSRHPFAITNNMTFGPMGYGTYPYHRPPFPLFPATTTSTQGGSSDGQPDSPLGNSEQNSSNRRRNLETMNDDSTSPTTSNSQPVNANTASRRRSRRSDDAGTQQPRQAPRFSAAQLLEYNNLVNSGNPGSRRQVFNAFATSPDTFDHTYETMDELRSLPEYRLSLEQRRRAQGARRDGPKGLDDDTDGRPPPKEMAELTVSLECKVCMTQLVDTVMLPCGHAVLCQWCADQHISPSKSDPTRSRGDATCPMCRTPVKQKFRIYIN